MSEPAGMRREFGEGPLARAAALVHTLVVIELLLLLTTAPCLLLLGLLGHAPGNLPLAAACALPAGPAWSAALYAWHHRRRDLTDLRPAAAFRRGYRANAAGVLRLWAPWLGGLTIIGVNLTHLDLAGVPRWWAAPLVAIALVSALWAANALVIVSLFTFRTVDAARLAAYFLVRSAKGTAGHLGLLLTAAALTAASSEAVPALLGSVFAALTLLGSRRMTDEIRERFTRPGDHPADRTRSHPASRRFPGTPEEHTGRWGARAARTGSRRATVHGRTSATGVRQ